jgi:hypothetical protein
MTAATFANFSKTGPNPSETQHGALVGNTTRYTCHMAVMHWAFMDLGDTQAAAHGRVEAINEAKCVACNPGGGNHGSIPATWYGANFCGVGGVHIPNRAALYAAVNVGDVLIVSNPARPMHSMVVVKKSSVMGYHFVYIRGLNNYGTTGTGIYLRYDNSDRDIDTAALWRQAPPVLPPVLGAEVFGNGGAELYVIPFANYIASATVAYNNCNNGLGGWAYVGP